MDMLLLIAHYVVSFFIVISVVVAIHEFGHYIVAKWCGVKIEAFSIGFGKEIWGRTDKSGTRWKISLLPLGGYVKMYGDASAASNADTDKLAALSPEEKALTFHHKSLPRKAAIVAAGPFANFLLTIALLTYFIMTSGLPSTEPVVGAVMPDTPAQAAGLKPGDRVLEIDGKRMRRFNDIPMYMATNVGKPVTLVIERAGEQSRMTITPQPFEDDDGLGNKIKRPLIGIRSQEIKYEEVGPVRALGEAVYRTYGMCIMTFEVLGQIIRGERSATELKGPVGIAQMSGQATDKGISTTLWLIAMLSANLGLVNLFPIPVLDGGHLLFYATEAARGRPMAQRMQEWSYRVGFAMLMMLMALTFYNDLRALFNG